MLHGKLAIRAHFIRRYFQMAAKSVGDYVSSCERANGRGAHVQDVSPLRLPVKHGIKLNDAMDVGERHAQGAAHFCCNGLGEPAMELLRSVQGRQESSAALGRELGKYGAQASEFRINHLVSARYSLRQKRDDYLTAKVTKTTKFKKAFYKTGPESSCPSCLRGEEESCQR